MERLSVTKTKSISKTNKNKSDQEPKQKKDDKAKAKDDKSDKTNGKLKGAKGKQTEKSVVTNNEIAQAFVLQTQPEKSISLQQPDPKASIRSTLAPDEKLVKSRSKITNTKGTRKNSSVSVKEAVADSEPGDIAADLTEEFWEEAWTICSQRFYERKAPLIVTMELRNDWLRLIEMSWLETGMQREEQREERSSGTPINGIFIKDKSFPPMDMDPWSRGVLTEFPLDQMDSENPSGIFYLDDHSDNDEAYDGYKLLAFQPSQSDTIKINSEEQDSSHFNELSNEEETEEKVETVFQENIPQVVKVKTEPFILEKSQTKTKAKTKYDSKQKQNFPKVIDSKKQFKNGPTKSKKKVIDDKAQKLSKPQKKLEEKVKPKKKSSKIPVPIIEKRDSLLHRSSSSDIIQIQAPGNTAVTSSSNNEEMEDFPFIEDYSIPFDLEVERQTGEERATESIFMSLNSEKNFHTLFSRGKRSSSSQSSLDVADYYKIRGLVPWTPKDCGAHNGNGVFRLPRETTSEALKDSRKKSSFGPDGDTLKKSSREKLTELPIEYLADVEEMEEVTGFSEQLQNRKLSEIDLNISPIDIQQYKLTTSEQSFYNYKMSMLRSQLMRQQQLEKKEKVIRSSRQAKLSQKPADDTKVDIDEMNRKSFKISPSEEMRIEASLAAKGIKIPKFQSETDNHKRKTILLRHSVERRSQGLVLFPASEVN